MTKRTTSGTPDGAEPVDDTERGRSGPDRSEEQERPDEQNAICPVGFCPIGAAVNTAGAVRPDAVGHLLSAGREFLLAARAVIDERADEVDRAVRDLEKIDIG